MKKRRELFPSEYQQEFTHKEQKRVEICKPTDDFAERIEDWEIDLRKTSDLLSFEEKQKFVKKLERKYNHTVYQDFFRHPALRGSDTDEGEKEKDFERELLHYVQNLYFNPHNEKVLAPPVTSKRVFGYMRQKFLHAQLSTYQDTHGRVGGDIMLNNTNNEEDKKTND